MATIAELAPELEHYLTLTAPPSTPEPATLLFEKPTDTPLRQLLMEWKRLEDALGHTPTQNEIEILKEQNLSPYGSTVYSSMFKGDFSKAEKIFIKLAKSEIEYEPITEFNLEVLDSADPHNRYFKEIKQFPQLTYLDELNLGCERDQAKTEIESSIRKILKAKKHMEEDKEAEEDLDSAKRKKVNAIHTLTLANLQIVVDQAHRYANIHNMKDLINDLIQEGNIALVTAAEKYEWETGNRFSTYAKWWMRAGFDRIRYELGYAVNIPRGGAPETLSGYYKAMESLDNNGQQPSHKDIARQLHTKPQTLTRLVQAGQKSLSLNKTINNESDSTLADLIQDNEDPYEEVLSSEAEYQTLSWAKEILSTVELTVIALRFGFDHGEILPLIEIGEKLGLTPDNVFSIQQEAMAKLRTDPRFEPFLKSFQSSAKKPTPFGVSEKTFAVLQYAKEHGLLYDISQDDTTLILRYYETEASLSDLTEVIHKTMQTVRNRIINKFGIIWQRLPEPMQAENPREEIIVMKPPCANPARRLS